MADDIRMAFNYRDINIELYNLAQDERKKRASEKNSNANKNQNNNPNDPNNPDDPPQNPTEPTQPQTNEENKQTNKFEKKKELIFTQFLGQKDELHFSSRSYRRSVENSNFSDQAEIGYFLKDCRNRVNKSIRSQCLWRRVSPVIDDKVDEGGSESVLLENVVKLELRYIGPGSAEDEWRDNWMTDERGDATTQKVFPYAVEITLEVKDKEQGKDKPMSMTIVAPIAFPNNYIAEKEKEGANQQQQQQQTQ